MHSNKKPNHHLDDNKRTMSLNHNARRMMAANTESLLDLDQQIKNIMIQKENGTLHERLKLHGSGASVLVHSC